ncbi:dihydrofolate reductase [Arsenicitalea aurantiaca]|uniref:Dihydrofolate reductase n=2 Tax=Arsenicitalea aurantiaca TaxID=1783274 RepID=A0A433XMU3_9HYPH|nr:dihydrofolate reductase [Arsenicitalea aurantiaca]
MIAAVARNGVIGADNAMPWHLPTDFAFFKRQTLGKPLIMGRRTFESIGKPLPGRTNIVVTRQPGYHPDGVIVISGLAEALGHAEAIALADGAEEIMIGGGATLYEAFMPVAQRLYITHVDLEPEGDTRFPEIDPALWEAVAELDAVPTERDSASFRITQYARRGGPKR